MNRFFVAVMLSAVVWPMRLAAIDPAAAYEHEKSSLLSQMSECAKVIVSKTEAVKVLGISSACYDRRGNQERLGFLADLSVDAGAGKLFVYHRAYVIVKPLGARMEQIRAYEVDKVASLPEVFLLSDKEFENALVKIEAVGKKGGAPAPR